MAFIAELEDDKTVFAPSFPAVYHAIYLEELTAAELTEKLAQLFNISPRQISQIFKQGPTGIHVLVSDEVRAGFPPRFSFTGLHGTVQVITDAGLLLIWTDSLFNQMIQNFQDEVCFVLDTMKGICLMPANEDLICFYI